MFNLKKYEAIIDISRNMHMSERYDLAIIGSGPYGLSEASDVIKVRRSISQITELGFV